MKKTMEEITAGIQRRKTADASGQILSDGINANMSSIWTALIKEAARCNRYSSDILIDIRSIENKMKGREIADGDKWYFGFRKDGVDHAAFIETRLDNGNNLYRDYFALYMLEAKEGEYSDMEFTLYNYSI